ncbi:hypothetical protein [Tistlia consotensis]|uniref:hypothetical protein n=1 Tax=Tistlia consotensis TaxID=1321365 RepID=UPI000A14CF24|nr:hypothetical protein [Tistlia consotensis]
MRRVLVLGGAGAGKTVFARRLGAATGLPVVHLDRHYWRPGWTALAPADWQAEVERLAAAPRWIMDGNYAGSLPLRLARADTVVLLDPPRRTCLWRVTRRTLRHWRRVRPELGSGCPERFDWGFLCYVWTYRKVHRPRVLAALEGFKGRVLVLRDRAEVEACLARLAASAAA